MFGRKRTTKPQQSPTQPRQKKRGLRYVIIVMAGLVVVSAALILPAQAGPAQGTIIRNWETGRCLDSNWAGQVYTLGCNGGDYQGWRIEYVGQREVFVYHIVNVKTGRCLDTAAAGYVQTTPCEGHKEYQLWHAAGTDGMRKIELRQYSFRGSCLDSNRAGSVYKLRCNGGGFQLWRADGSM
jgi:serine/threonine-protein kinase